ncbi:MAG: ABC transporter permease [Lachnospiraceae bacterium]|jgi:cell division transport system permease protein|uniref:permease-like cell division protein FtsX n=1 Tax=Acetatifactor sp. TaxID=1872090 RepID=UPI0015A00FB9|nr:ABC transporter permease [Lachnospiraceae bacterium]MEE0152491.1 permease-like cell division protein FtsX [Acetatifactor sp.]
MKISTLLYTIKQGFANIFRNKWYSLASIATISACLFLFGLFYSIVANFQNILKTAEEGVSVTVFFHSEWDGCESHIDGQIPSEQRIEEIGQEIAKRAEVSDVQFKSADEAWATFGPDYFGEDYAEGFPENPLAGEDSYEIFLSDVSMQDALVTWLQSIPEVRKVNYSEMTANTLSGLNLLIAYVSMGIIVILLAVSIFLISNTVAIGISVRSEEINIMKYIGATDFFVRAPFVLEGMLIGLIGAAVPLGLIYSLYNYALNYMVNRFMVLSGFLNFLSVDEVFHFLVPVSLGVGVGIGFLGSISTVRKHLHV